MNGQGEILRDYLAKLGPDQLVQIGCDGGTGYIYAGPIKDYQEWICNDFKPKDNRQKRIDDCKEKLLHKEELGLRQSVITRYETIIRQKQEAIELDGVPVIDREIVSVTKSTIFHGALNILVKGDHMGKEELCMKDLWPEDVDVQAAQALVGQVYHGLQQELQSAYLGFNGAARIERKMNRIFAAQRAEREIRLNRYGMLSPSSAEYIIDETKRKVFKTQERIDMYEADRRSAIDEYKQLKEKGQWIVLKDDDDEEKKHGECEE